MKRRTNFYPAALLVLLFTAAPLRAAALAPGDMLAPVGEVVVIDLDTDGVLVAGLAQVETENGCVSPAETAGVQAGDCITAVNGQAIHSSEDFVAALEAARGQSVSLRAVRNGTPMEFCVTPALGTDGSSYLGLWLRGGLSGIGTVTFQCPENGVYGALGHGVCSGEDGTPIPILGGAISRAQVSEVVPGVRGTPGELVGTPAGGASLGEVARNTEAGIFGRAAALTENTALPVADDTEVVLGKAQILSTVTDRGPQLYDVEITRVDRNESDLRQLSLRVTDPRLLQLTGGIVQGMSGSPIIQNGKLVGAVTHVLVNSPDTGYGIFIENMLDAAE